MNDQDVANCSSAGANQNLCNVDPTLADVTAANFAIGSGSTAINYGQSPLPGFYSLVAAFQTTVVSERIRLESDP